MSTKKLRVVGVVVAGLLALGACSSGGTTTTAPSPTSAPAMTTTTVAADAHDICAVFGEIAASGAGQGSEVNPTTAADWEKRIELTGELVATAPAEWRDEAETYLQLVKDRAKLAADNGYVGVDDLPADVRTSFINDHRDEQAQVNNLIAYMKSACGAPTAA